MYKGVCKGFFKVRQTRLKVRSETLINFELEGFSWKQPPVNVHGKRFTAKNTRALDQTVRDQAAFLTIQLPDTPAVL